MYHFNNFINRYKHKCKKNGYTLTEEAGEYAAELFNTMYEERDENFGNGRDVRNRFEDMIARQADRVAALDAPTKDDLMALLPEDIGGEANG